MLIAPAINQLIAGCALGVAALTAALIVAWVIQVAIDLYKRDEHPEGMCECMWCYTFRRSES